MFALSNKSLFMQDFPNLSKAEAKEKLSWALRKYGLDKLIDADLVISWFQRSDAINQVYLRIAICLLPPSVDEKVMMKLADAILVCNRTWAIGPDGLTPDERLKKSPEDFGKNGFVTNVLDFSCRKAMIHHDLGMIAMQSGNGKRAVKEFQEMFSLFLADGMLVNEPYRLYGNLAMAYLCSGNRQHAEDALTKSLTWNPKYDFAIETKRKLDDGEFDTYLKETKLKNKSSKPVPSDTFFAFISSFGINFATSRLTTTPHKIVSY